MVVERRAVEETATEEEAFCIGTLSDDEIKQADQASVTLPGPDGFSFLSVPSPQLPCPWLIHLLLGLLGIPFPQQPPSTFLNPTSRGVLVPVHKRGGVWSVCEGGKS